MEDKSSKFNVNFYIRDTDVFKDIVSFLKSALEDERIPKNVRLEYSEKLIELLAK